MKSKLLSLFLGALFLFSCSDNDGSIGPVGPEGPQGPAGLIGSGFERTVTFNEGNDYSQLITIPNSIEVFSSDIILVYLLFEENAETGNDVWQPLPATYYLDDGSQLQYGFDHTLADVQLFLGGNTSLNTLSPIYTDNQTFRIAILPVEDVEAQHINLQNVQEVMGAIGEQNFSRIQSIKK